MYCKDSYIQKESSGSNFNTIDLLLFSLSCPVVYTEVCFYCARKCNWLIYTQNATFCILRAYVCKRSKCGFYVANSEARLESFPCGSCAASPWAWTFTPFSLFYIWFCLCFLLPRIHAFIAQHDQSLSNLFLSERHSHIPSEKARLSVDDGPMLEEPRILFEMEYIPKNSQSVVVKVYQVPTYIIITLILLISYLILIMIIGKRF